MEGGCMKTIVIYYSYSGNTKKIAELIAKKLNADIAKIETENAYTGSYDAVVDQAKKEIEQGYMPKIKPISFDLEKYDTIILGSPVWWYTFAPAMKTFLNENNLKNKTIYPFATNAGWLGHTFKDFEKTCRDCIIKEGLNLEFEGKNLLTPQHVISKWIENIK